MNKKNLIFCAIILIVGIYWLVFGGSGQVVTVTILHLNDSESQLIHAGKGIEDFGGAARCVTVVKSLRSAAATDVVLTLSSGDNFLAGPEFEQPVFNHLRDIKRIASRINDIAGRIRSQFNQIPAQKTVLLLIRFPDKILNLAVYFF